ncbi:MAG: NADAR family protein [Magnetococcales bacterium]|nr:NADAR family protein [Magnetococcales bacterium]
MLHEIQFYRANEKPYGVFSNLYKREILFEGEIFPTAEHAYQAGKPRKKEVRDWLMAAPSPSLVAMAAHGLYIWDVRSDWNNIKFDRMKQILKEKFVQHPDLADVLRSTGNARLVEAANTDSPVNRLWGEVNGKGKNMLGILLMEIREILLQPSESVKKSLPNPKGTQSTESALSYGMEKTVAYG